MSNSTPGHALPIASGALSSNSFQRVENKLMEADCCLREAMREALPIDDNFAHEIAQNLFAAGVLVQIWQRTHRKELGI
jgi:hypothetical protein